MNTAARRVDPYLIPQAAAGNRLARLLWQIVYIALFRPSPRPFHRWRAFLLRCFGARLGARCHIYPRARIWAPWNLACADVVAIADGAVVYNPSAIEIGSHATVSQDAYLCGATHDIDDPSFPMVSSPITIGPRAWICARAAVLPGVKVGEGAVLALGAVAARDLQSWSVYTGNPARFKRMRVHGDV